MLQTALLDLLQEKPLGQIREASDTHSASVALCTYVDTHRKLWSTLLAGGAAAVLREELLRLRQKRPVSIARVAEIHKRVIITPTIEADKNWTRRVKRKKKN
jgi:hypothetical protein